MIYLILLAGIILRLISLNQSLWLDEATSALVAKMPITDIFTKFLPGDFHPPLYYLILKYWSSVFGYSEVSLRIPSVIFGVLTIYVSYLIAKDIFDKKTAIVSSLFIATSGLAVYYSQEARMYCLALLLVSVSIYLFTHKKWVIFSIILLLIGATDYVALFIIPIFFIVNFKNWKKIALCLIPLVIGIIFWMPVFISQFGNGISITGSAWWNILGSPSFKNIILIPIKFMLGRITFDNKSIYSIIIIGTSIVFGYLLLKTIKTSKLLWAWLTVPIIIGLVISFKIPTLSYFRFLFCLPAFYILLAKGIDFKTFSGKLLFILVLAINISSTSYYLFNPKFQREDWRLAAATIKDDKVVLPADSQKEALTYYKKGNQIVSIADLSRSNHQVWLSRYVWEIFDPKDSTRKKLEDLGYNKAQEYNFNGVVFWKYIKK